MNTIETHKDPDLYNTLWDYYGGTKYITHNGGKKKVRHGQWETVYREHLVDDRLLFDKKETGEYHDGRLKQGTVVYLRDITKPEAGMSYYTVINGINEEEAVFFSPKETIGENYKSINNPSSLRTGKICINSFDKNVNLESTNDADIITPHTRVFGFIEWKLRFKQYPNSRDESVYIQEIGEFDHNAELIHGKRIYSLFSIDPETDTLKTVDLYSDTIGDGLASTEDPRLYQRSDAITGKVLKKMQNIFK